MTMTVRRLGPSIGAEISGIDVNRIDDAELSEIRRIWLESKVAVLSGQNLTEEGLIAFGKRFGELEIHVRSTYHSKHHPEVMVVSNLKKDGKAIGVLGDGEAKWHIDQAYMPQPTFGTILYAEAVPPEGGDTYFADLSAAYERLPPTLRDRIAPLKGVNSVDRHNRRDSAGRPDLQMSTEQLKRAPDSPHPLVKTHPLIGRKSLYFSPSHTCWIEGQTEEASQPLFDELLGYMTSPDIVYRHRWNVGDIVMWDNSSTMHRRDPFPGDYTRLMKRVSFKYPAQFRAAA